MSFEHISNGLSVLIYYFNLLRNQLDYLEDFNIIIHMSKVLHVFCFL